jgi:hypothetical protein
MQRIVRVWLAIQPEVYGNKDHDEDGEKEQLLP